MIEKPANASSPLIAIAFLAVLFWMLASSAYNGAVNPNSGVTGGDFKFFYAAAERLNHGQPLYVYQETGATYVYSPLLAVTLRPVAAMGRDRAISVWAIVNIGCVAASIFFFARAARLSLRDAVLIGLIAIMTFRCWVSVMTFGLGQANFLLLLSVAILYWADATDRPWAAALAIAFGVLIKTWMIGLVLYLLMRRQYKAAILTGASLAGALVLLFTLVGWNELGLFIDLTRAYASKQMGLMVISQSISGFAQLHFSDNQHVQALFASPIVRQAVNIAGHIAVLAVLARMAFLPAAASLFDRRLRLGATILCLLLLLPYCANEYYVLALPVLWTLLTPGEGVSRRSAVAMAVAAFVGYVALTRPTPTPPLAPEFTQGLGALKVSTTFAIGIGLLGSVAWFLMRLQRKPHVPATESAVPAAASASIA